jgi:hypothetical protein
LISFDCPRCVRVFFGICALLISKPVLAQSSILWQRSYGGSADDGASCIVQTTDRGFVFAGHTNSNDGDVTGLHGVSNDDIWVVKLDSLGNIEWEIPFGGTQRDEANSIIQTFDGGYALAGSTSSGDGDIGHATYGGDDFWLLKLGKTGGIEWEKTFGGSGDDDAYSIIQTADSGFAVAGRTFSNDSDVTGNHGSEDYWVLRLNLQGKLLWQRAYGSRGADEAHAIVQTFDGGFAVAGWAGSNGGDVVGEHGSADFWILQLDTNGTLKNGKCFGGSSGDFAYSLAQTSDSGFVIAGSTTSSDGDVTGIQSPDTSDAWIVRLNKALQIMWEKTYGGTNEDMAEAIVSTLDGGYAVAGYTGSSFGGVQIPIADSGTYDGWVFKLDRNGEQLWQETLGGVGDDFFYSICNTSDGGLAVAGTTTSVNGSDGGQRNDQNVWIARFSALSNKVPLLTEQAETRLAFFPNPASKFVRLALEQDQGGVRQYTVVDCVGRTVLSGSAREEESNKRFVRFDVSNLPSGLYSVVVQTYGIQHHGIPVVGKMMVMH